MELRMCCPVEGPHPSYCSILCYAQSAHPTASSPSHPRTITGTVSTNFKGRGGLYGDSRTHGGQMHRLEHMAEQRQAFDVSSADPFLIAPATLAPTATTAGWELPSRRI